MKTLFNPFMPYKHLHPRMAGLIAYKGGGGGGATPEQVDASVAGGVSAVNSNTDAGFADAKQYGKGLTDGLGSQISGVSGQVSGVQNTVSGLDSQISGVGSSVTTGFSGLNDYLASQFTQDRNAQEEFAKGLGSNLQQLDARNQASFGELGNTLGTVDSNITEGFADQTQRFDTLDTSVGNVQQTADTVQQAVNDGRVEATNNFNTTTGTLENMAGEISESFTAAGNDRATNQTALQDANQEILSDLGTVSSTQDTYYEDLSGTLGDVQTTQDTFTTNFDEYTQKYGTDQETEVETLGRLETGLGENFESLRRDIGQVADSTDRIEGVEDSVSGLDETVEGGFTEVAGDVASLDDTVGEGFTETGQNIDDTEITLEDRVGQLVAGLKGNTEEMERLFGASATAVDKAFDDQGKLIRETVSADGTITRNAVDDTGTLVTSQFTAQGELIGRTSTNLMDAVGVVGSEVADRSAITSLINTLGANVSNLSADFMSQYGNLVSAFDAQGTLIKNTVAENGDTITRELTQQGKVLETRFDAQGNLIGTTETNLNDAITMAQRELGLGQEGIMSEMNAAQATQFDQVAMQIADGFEEQTGQMNTQVADIAGLASQMSELDMGMRQEFFQLSGAFDDTGALIRQEVTDNGETIRRNIDQNGNLLIQRFDQTGQSIGNKFFNINEALSQLAGLGTLPGASVSMGNLSPALQASPNGQSNVPTGGFMAPFSLTV